THTAIATAAADTTLPTIAVRAGNARVAAHTTGAAGAAVEAVPTDPTVNAGHPVRPVITLTTVSTGPTGAAGAVVTCSAGRPEQGLPAASGPTVAGVTSITTSAARTAVAGHTHGTRTTHAARPAVTAQAAVAGGPAKHCIVGTTDSPGPAGPAGV